jgi:GAF domain-containing protein
LPETEDALRQLAVGGDPALSIELFDIAQRVRELAPDLVGLSLALVEDDITLTLVASAEQIAALDAVQYVDDGPCVSAVEQAQVIHKAVDDLLDEGQWLLYAKASAAHGIASSLTLPITEDGRVTGSVNIYGATPDAFEGRHDAIAEAVGSKAEHVIVNADLSFRTARDAAETPARIREGAEIETAVGMIAAARDVSIAVARIRLADAALRAGITQAQAARVIAGILSP